MGTISRQVLTLRRGRGAVPITASNEPDPRDGRWQFSLRGLLLLSVLCGIVLTVIAPAIRAWNREQLLAGMGHVAIIVLPTALLIARSYFLERNTRRSAGRLLFTLYRPGARDRAAMLWLATASTALLVLVVVLNDLADMFSSIVLAAVTAIIIPPTFLNAFTRIIPGQIEICEHGLILSGRRFIPRQRFTHWTTEGKLVTVQIDAFQIDASLARPRGAVWRVQFELPDEARQDVMETLNAWRPESSTNLT